MPASLPAFVGSFHGHPHAWLGKIPRELKPIFTRIHLDPRAPCETRKRFYLTKCVSHYTCDTRFRVFLRCCARGHVGSADCSYIHVQNQGQQA
jgi:hypothetical protein